VTISSALQAHLSPVFPPLLPEFSDGDYSPFNDSYYSPSVRQANADPSYGGTGVIVSEDGLIWTSSDVVHGLDSVNVTLQTQISYEGKVLLCDPDSGLAIVKVDADKLPAAHFGSTAKPRLADWAIAVALDDSHEPIFSAGLISSFRRAKRDSQGGTKTIRFAFPISADFTGCAFVNLRGELMGINALSSSSIDIASSSCVALHTQSALELQRNAIERTAATESEFHNPTCAMNDSIDTHDLTEHRKEGMLSKFDTIRELFSVPRSHWTSATIASSIRNWFASWQDAIDPRTHPDPNASEPR
jgi:hypothetical protein